MRRLYATCVHASSLAAAGTLRLVLGIAVSLMSTSQAGAQTVFNWDPPPRFNLFSTAGNWTPAGPPGTTGEARFNTGSSGESVSFNTDPTNARLRVGNDHVTLNLNGHTYTLTSTSTSSPSIMVGGITLADDALLSIRDGTLAGQHAVIAPAALQLASAMSAMVVDTGGALNLAGTFTIGKQLPGSLTIQNGGDVTSATGVLGESGNGNGVVTVTGNGSTWHNTGSVYVGGQAAIDGGNGTLSITNQGLVDIDGTLKLWPGGNVALNGGTLRLQALQLAGGSFNWTSGTLRFSSDLSIDPSGPLGGSAAVGAGKVLEAGGDLYVGNGGSGALSVTGGAIVSVETFIGANGGGGEVSVDDSVFLAGKLIVGDSSNGSIELTNRGHLNSLAGRIGANGAVTVTGPGSSWFNNLALTIGAGGDGSLAITNGGFVETTTEYQFFPVFYPGDGTIAGSVTVDGTGSRWEVEGSLFVRDDGTLQVTNGGLVLMKRLVFPGFEVPPSYSHIGYRGSSGAITVDGVGSAFINRDGMFIGTSSEGALTVSNGGAVLAGETAPIVIGSVGEVNGDGILVGDVHNSGVVFPGLPLGALHVDGTYTQTAAGTLLIELSSATSYDELLVTDNATLAGTLTVNLIDGFIPSIGRSFAILTADDIDGTFATELLPSVPGLTFDVIYNPQSVVLTVAAAGLPGDYNGDGTVDAADYVVWRKNPDGFGGSAGYDTWRTNFGRSAGSAATAELPARAAVPEPATLWLVLLFIATAVGIAPRPRSRVSPKLATASDSLD